MMNDNSVLIIGGTGSFGHAFGDYVLGKCNVKKIIIYSRDGFKQLNEELNLHRLWAEIYDFDEKKKCFFDTLGFNLEGRHRETQNEMMRFFVLWIT